MPEIIEIELYRRAAEAVVGRRVVRVHAPDSWYLKRGLSAAGLQRAVVGGTVVAVRRRGKLLMLDVAATPGAVTVGLRFGMTGRLIVDGEAAIHELEYGSSRALPEWERLRLELARAGQRSGSGTDRSTGFLAISDPRRLGGVELEPDETMLGPDAYGVTGRQLDRALGRSAVAVKARLLDQQHLAGLGNLLADEILWRAGIDPARPTQSIDDRERAAFGRMLRRVLDELTARGGSHTGDLQIHRRPGGCCPRDGAVLERRRIGGRTTFSCPRHQR